MGSGCAAPWIPSTPHTQGINVLLGDGQGGQDHDAVVLEILQGRWAHAPSPHCDPGSLPTGASALDAVALVLDGQGETGALRPVAQKVYDYAGATGASRL